MGKKQRRNGICTYCAGTKPLTADHIPPKNLFPKPLPNDLITVPSCRDCNNAASRDDEYFRLVTVFRQRVSDHPAARSQWAPVFRSLRRPEQQRFRNAFVRTLRPVELRSPAGIFLGQSGTFQTDLVRVNRVAERITRGLYYHEFEKILPRQTNILVLSALDLDDPEHTKMIPLLSGSLAEAGLQPLAT